MIFILLFASLLVNFLFMMLTILLPILVNNITHSYLEVGNVLMTFMISLLLIRLFCLIKRIKPIVALLGGGILFLGGFLLLYLVKESLLVFFIGSAFFGIAIGLVPPAILTLLTDGENSESNIQKYNIIVAFSSACAPFVADKLYKTSTVALYIVWLIGACVLVFLSLFLIKYRLKKGNKPIENYQSISVKSNELGAKRYLEVFLILFLSSISYGAFIAYLSIYLTSIKVSIGLFYFLFWSAYVLAQYMRKWVNMKKIESTMIPLALFICLISDVVLSFCRQSWFIYGAGFFYGLMYGLLFNIFYINASSISNEKMRNNVYAIIGLMSYIGVGVAPIFLSPFLHYGLKNVFVFSSLYLLLAIVIQLLYSWIRKRKKV